MSQTALLMLAGQVALSLVAIGLIYGLCRWLGLGDDVRLPDAETALQLARTAEPGFEPADFVLDRAGIGALLRDGQGRVMLLRRHGAHFVGRMIDSHAGARLDRNFLSISTSDKWFGTVTLDLGPQAQVWAGSFRRLGAAA